MPQAPSTKFFALNPQLADLHVHVGSISDPALLWDISHYLGFKLPAEDYWSFAQMMVAKDIEGEDAAARLNRYLKFFHLTERIQSSPYAMERVIYDAVSRAYRNYNITKLELRFCPMWRNRQGEHDLDYIMIASLHALDKASIAFPEVKTGIILEFDRRLTKEQNTVILEKAIKYKGRGVVGIDIAGPRVPHFSYMDYVELYQEAIMQGLSTTIHAGEEGSADEMKSIVANIPLHRVGHGVKAYTDLELMKMLVDRDITLEICPTSNLTLGIVDGLREFKEIIRTFIKNDVKFTINTDGPILLNTDIKKEISLLLDHQVVSLEEMLVINNRAHEASFIVKR
ncbi:adenosine deaminase [Rickettsiales endosymbiont of Peranema trichophorum]|uniref:adenosine deaminase n=1 Tax=Rickettsiales endosymbiont of Peranema trichophorum TaxID=2486577 RepID=UPI001023249C|nr:adenosine deaminase [Rickettsiales endosymbiont of Peranema trichophorum]RZI47298.1 adenosine deaminase [Rickettsiales endosymbiont of Peranema trichophorum]